MEVSRKCLSLLNSQDGGILTVSFSQGNPETASFVVLLLFCFILKSPHISDSTDSLRYEADYILLKTMPIAHKYQICLWFQGIW